MQYPQNPQQPPQYPQPQPQQPSPYLQNQPYPQAVQYPHQPPLPQGQQPYPQQQPFQRRTGLNITVGHEPLAWMLAFCKPKIVIDGQVQQYKWGTYFFDVAPGRHRIEIYFQYFWASKCGANGMDVMVAPGQTLHVSYYMPPWMFAHGDLKVTGWQ